MPLEQILDNAEHTWREVVRTEYPLFAATPVVRAKPNPKNKRHWMFYTDNKTIHVDVFKPEVIEKLFTGKIKKLFAQAYHQQITNEEELVRRLHHDNFTYLHFHELFHPIYSPDSRPLRRKSPEEIKQLKDKGALLQSSDEELTDLALYQGAKKALPHLQPADLLNIVGNARNAVWDLIIDSAFFYLSNYNHNVERRIRKVLEDKNIDLAASKQLPDGVITIFDIVELEENNEPRDSLFYPLTRMVYSLLFCKNHDIRKEVFEYFQQEVNRNLHGKEKQAVTDALKYLLKELSPGQIKFAGINPTEFEKSIEELYSHYGEAKVDSTHFTLISQLVNLLLDKNTRYPALEGFIQPLAKYISLRKEEKRHGTHISDESEDGSSQQEGQSSGNQGGGNTQQALLNLAELLGEQEANNLLLQVANCPGGSQGGHSLRDQRLANLARDEYYKKNAKEINIRSPRQEAVSVDLGKLRQPVLISTLHLQPEEVLKLNLEEIIKFQQETGITQLFQISEHEFRYDIYEWQEVDILDYKFEPTGIDLPENVVFQVDSSSSMGSSRYVGTGEKYDTLMHVCYGIIKTLVNAAKESKKEVNVISANFSNRTILCDKPSEIQQMYNTPNNKVKEVLTGFQNGGTVYSADTFRRIKPMLKPGKTVHVWVTDGNLNSECITPTFREIEKITQDKEVSFLYFEIGSQSTFGGQIKQLEAQRPNVKCYMGVTIPQIQNQALEVMIQYDDQKKYQELIKD